MLSNTPTLLTEMSSYLFRAKSGESISNDIGSPVITIPLTPKIYTLVASATTSGVVAQAMPNKTCYVTGINVSLLKDAACDIATGTINLTATIDNGSKTLLTIPIIALTAQAQTFIVQLPTPIRVDPSSTLSLSGTFTLGICVRCWNIRYFVAE